MDCKQAEDLQLAVKYVLGELPPVQRDEYEDHYIDCPQCAKEVYAAAALTDTAREVFRQEERGEAPAPVRDAGRDVARDGARGGWLARWLRPAFAVPAFAVLLLVVAYQNTVTIPRAKLEAASGAGQVLTASFTFPKTQTRGARGGGEGVKAGEDAGEKEAFKVKVKPNESFGLRFDFNPPKTLDSYLCELQDESGRTLLQKAVPGTSIHHEVEIGIPGGLVKAANYSLVFHGAPGANGEGAREEVLRLGFSVEFLP